MGDDRSATASPLLRIRELPALVVQPISSVRIGAATTAPCQGGALRAHSSPMERAGFSTPLGGSTGSTMTCRLKVAGRRSGPNPRAAPWPTHGPPSRADAVPGPSGAHVTAPTGRRQPTGPSRLTSPTASPRR